jgi:hypothetical protein
MDRNELPFAPHHLGVPLGASKTISKAMVYLAQTVHLSCTETSTVSKWTEMSFHLSLVTQVYLPAQLKQFMSLWYVWRKMCTSHAPKLTLSRKGPKGDSTWPTSTRRSIECVQNDFLRQWYVWCNLWIYIAPRLTLYPNGPKRDSTWPTSSRSSIGCVQMISELTVRSAKTVHLSWIKVSTISKRTEMRFHLSLVT